MLGASRGQILAAYAVEYGAVGLIAGAAGVALGYAAAWPVVVKVFRSDWSVDWAGVAALVGGAALLAAARRPAGRLAGAGPAARAGAAGGVALSTRVILAPRRRRPDIQGCARVGRTYRETFDERL